MPDLDARLDRMEQAIRSLTGVTGELVRENHALVQGFASDRALFRETLREVNGFVAIAGVALERVERQIEQVDRHIGEVDRQIGDVDRQIGVVDAHLDRLTEVTEAGFTRLQATMAENNRRITENNEAIRRLLDILRRGRENGDAAPA